LLSVPTSSAQTFKPEVDLDRIGVEDDMRVRDDVSVSVDDEARPLRLAGRRDGADGDHAGIDGLVQADQITFADGGRQGNTGIRLRGGRGREASRHRLHRGGLVL
jgi:hypothetical protein